MKTCPIIKQNEGQTDRIIRIVVGILAIAFGMTVFTGVVQTVALIVGVIALATGIIGFCGLYALLGISTQGKN